ncbi:unnamed protein product, partial [Ectocarpus sp. 13 AM-2016]
HSGFCVHEVSQCQSTLSVDAEHAAAQIDDVEAAIAGGSGYLGMTDPEALFR